MLSLSSDRLLIRQLKYSCYLTGFNLNLSIFINVLDVGTSGF